MKTEAPGQATGRCSCIANARASGVILISNLSMPLENGQTCSTRRLEAGAEYKTIDFQVRNLPQSYWRSTAGWLPSTLVEFERRPRYKSFRTFCSDVARATRWRLGQNLQPSNNNWGTAVRSVTSWLLSMHIIATARAVSRGGRRPVCLHFKCLRVVGPNPVLQTAVEIYCKLTQQTSSSSVSEPQLPLEQPSEWLLRIMKHFYRTLAGAPW